MLAHTNSLVGDIREESAANSWGAYGWKGTHCNLESMAVNVPLFVSCYMSLWFTGESQIKNRLPLRETYCEWHPRVFGHPQITLPVSSHSDLDFFSPDYCYVHHWVGGAVHICASNKVSERKSDTTENILLNCLPLLCRWRSDLHTSESEGRILYQTITRVCQGMVGFIILF